MTAPYKPVVPAPAPVKPGEEMRKSGDLSSQLFGAHGPLSSPLVHAGLTLATARGPQAILQALQSGQQAEQMRVAAAQAERERQVRDMLRQRLASTGDDPKSLLSMAREAMAYGSIDAAKELLDLAKAQQAASLMPTQVVKNDKTGETWLVNTQTGQKIEQLYGPQDASGLELTDVIKVKNDTADDWRSRAGEQSYDTVAAALKRVRDNAAMALNGHRESQEALLSAIGRIRDPQKTRGIDDEAVADMGRRGNFGGKLMDDMNRLLKDQLNPDEVNDWIVVANNSARGLRELHDRARREIIDGQLRPLGLGGDHLTDYFFFERVALPGIAPDRAAGLSKTMEK